MNNPIIVNCPANTWTLAAEAIKQGVIHRRISTTKYYWTYRVPGGSAPTDLSEAITLFDKNDNETIPQTTGMDVWIYTKGGNGAVRIDDTPFDSDVNVQNKRTPPIDLLFSRDISQTTLAATPVIGENTITVTSTAGAVVGTTWVELWDIIVIGNIKIPFIYQAQVRALPGGNVVEMYMPIGFPFNPSTTVVRFVEINMSIPTTATFNNPLIYSIDPPKLIGTELFVDFDETRFLCHMIHEAAGDDSRYGGIVGGVPNGLVFRGRGTISGPTTVYNHLFNIKLNGDWKNRAFDVIYDDRASPASQYSTTVRKSFNGREKSDVAIPVRSSLNEATEVLLRDDISITNTVFVRHSLIACGHVVATS